MVSDTIHVATIDTESESPTAIQEIGFTDYVTYKVNGNANDSSVEVFTINDVVVATIIPVNSTYDLISVSETMSLHDVLVVSLNSTDLINLFENISFSDSILVNDNSTLDESIIAEIQLEHNTIEINKPVIWTHDVVFSNDTESIAVEIPADAEILSIKTLNNTSETILFNSTEYVPNNSNYTGLYDDQDISDKDLKKYFRLIDSVQTIESKIDKTNEKIAYYADLDTAKAHKKLDKLESKLDKFRRKIRKET